MNRCAMMTVRSDHLEAVVGMAGSIMTETFVFADTDISSAASIAPCKRNEQLGT